MLGGLTLSLLAARVDAAEARYRLSVPTKPFADALIDLGVQANVSVIGTSACGTDGAAGLAGEFTLEEALAKLLAGAPCTYRILDPRTVRIATVARAAAVEPMRTPTLVTELLVTATKQPASVNQLAASVSVVPHDQIAITGAADVVQLSSQISGVLTTNLGPARDKLILRGLSDGAFTGHARSTVGSFLDDTAINYNAPDPDLQLVDVERVEVVRGPQGALYGSGSISGVFRIVPRKPDLTAFAFGAAGNVAETKGGSPSDEIDGYVNVPLVRGFAALRLVAYRDNQGGYIDNASLRLSNVDRTVREGGRIALRLQPSDSWQFDIAGIVQRLRSNDTQYTTPGAGPTTRRSQVQEGHKNDFAEASATARGELGWASFRATASIVDHAFSSQYDATQEVQTDFSFIPSTLGIYYERTRDDMLSADALLRSARPGRLNWLLGIYGSTSREKSPSALDVQPTYGPLQHAYTEARRDKLRETAIYGETSYAFAPGWTATAGGRFFDTNVRTQSDIVALPPGQSRNVDYSTNFDGFSPKLSIQREIDSQRLVYALFSEGYRAGGFNSGGLVGIRANRLSFAPDRLRNYEIGLKARLFDARMSLHSAIFYDQWRDIQTDQYRPSGIPYTANVGDADVAGWEAELDYDFDFGLSVQLNSLVADSRVTHANPDYAPDVVNALPTVPRLLGGALAVYRRPLPRNLNLNLIAEAGYVGSSAISFDARRNKTRMGEYARTRLSAQLAGRNWTASLFVINPANNAGNTFAYGNPFTFAQDLQYLQSTPQRPRTVGLRLTADY